ncbi:tetratricopeptide repeat protein [Streptomyces longispororuber]|uniref:tetratricopeptide repeat protein n=1 Tax=Streptomyces longispororuber TaxID=68230 RepID=UPI0033DB2DBC
MSARSWWEELAEGRRSFERAVVLLLTTAYPGLRAIEGAGGDRGEDAVLRLPGGRRHVFQVKDFTGRLTPGRRTQIAHSLRRAAEGRPDRWTLVAPLTLTPAEWDWFDRLGGTYPFPVECYDLTWLDTTAAHHPGVQALFGHRRCAEAPRAVPPALTPWPRVADTGPADAGLAVDDHGAVPGYVARDADPGVRARVRAAGVHGGGLLLVGDSAAGKTRTLYEALRAELPGHRFVRPAHPHDVPALVAGIAAAAEPCVLWLDELGPWLEDGRCLTAPALTELRRAGAAVLATLDAAAYTHRRGAEVLRRLPHLLLDRRWSPAERSRAAASPDRRVARAARADPALGVAECLAAGPWLWRELRLADRAGGRPRGAALTRAGIDLVRAGLDGPLPAALLLDAHRPYLADSGGDVLRPEPAADALAWAGTARCGVSGMLLPAGGDAWRAHPELAAAADDEGLPVHPFTWFQALGAARDLDAMFTVALNATRHAPSIGACLWRALADAGVTRAANNLGVVLADLGRHEEAERVYRTQADPEDAAVLLNLGNLLSATGRHDEAVRAYTASGTRGEAKAWNNLGLLHRDRGETAAAEVCLRSAALAGAADAEYNLGVLLADLGRADEAMAAYARAYAAGDADGLTNWGLLLCEEGRWSEAEPLLLRAVAAGSGKAMFCLAHAARSAGDPYRAAYWYRKCVDAGDPRACFNLANLHRDEGRPDLAEPLYRRAAGGGVTGALLNLGLLLARQERLAEAEPLLRRSAGHGHHGALFHLGDVLRRTGRRDEAAAHWKAAADAGDTDAAIGLATLLTDPADRPCLRGVLRRAAEAGDPDAGLLLSVLATEPATEPVPEP